MAPTRWLPVLTLLCALCCSAAATATCPEDIELVGTLQAALERAGSLNAALREQVAWWQWHYGADTPCMWPWAKPGSLGVAMAAGMLLSGLWSRRARGRMLKKHEAQLAALQRKLKAKQAQLEIADREATQYLVRLTRVANYGLAGCPQQAQQVARGASRQELKDAPRVKNRVREYLTGNYQDAASTSTTRDQRPKDPRTCALVYIAELEAQITGLKDHINHLNDDLASARQSAAATAATAANATQQQERLQHQAVYLERVVSALQTELDDERMACKNATVAATANARRVTILERDLHQANAVIATYAHMSTCQDACNALDHVKLQLQEVQALHDAKLRQLTVQAASMHASATVATLECNNQQINQSHQTQQQQQQQQVTPAASSAQHERELSLDAWVTAAPHSRTPTSRFASAASPSASPSATTNLANRFSSAGFGTPKPRLNTDELLAKVAKLHASVVGSRGAPTASARTTTPTAAVPAASTSEACVAEAVPASTSTEHMAPAHTAAVAATPGTVQLAEEDVEEAVKEEGDSEVEEFSTPQAA